MQDDIREPIGRKVKITWHSMNDWLGTVILGPYTIEGSTVYRIKLDKRYIPKDGDGISNYNSKTNSAVFCDNYFDFLEPHEIEYKPNNRGLKGLKDI